MSYSTQQYAFREVTSGMTYFAGEKLGAQLDYLLARNK